MKIRAIGLGALLAVGLGGCSAGVTAGSATFDSGPDATRVCTRTYGARVGLPDNPENGVHAERRCVVAPNEDDD